MAETILTFKSLSLIDCVGFLTTLNCALNFSSAIENIYYGDVHGYDSNAGDRKAEAFSIVNLRASVRQSYNNWNFSEFVRADNIFDEKYVGNVRVNNAATFEPGAPRNYTVGITSSYTFK